MWFRRLQDFKILSDYIKLYMSQVLNLSRYKDVYLRLKEIFFSSKNQRFSSIKSQILDLIRYKDAYLRQKKFFSSKNL